MGLSPAEVNHILENRFFIKLSNTTVKDALGKAPAGDFSCSPADFDGRAKLYRPMRGCLDRVEWLLKAAGGDPAENNILKAAEAGGRSDEAAA